MRQPPGPDFEFDECDDCGKRDRVFECYGGSKLCTRCYTELIEAVIETRKEREDHDAAA